MSGAVAIRQAVLADLDALAPLFDQYRQFYRQQADLAGARAFLRERFNHGEAVLLIAHEGETALGFVQMYPIFSSLSLQRSFLFNDLFVAPAGRQRGIGRGLIEAAAAYGKAVGATSLSLSTAVTNTSAQALYRSSGWVQDETYLYFDLSL